MDVFAFKAQYLQPLTPFSFLAARTEVARDRDAIVSGFTLNAPDENILYFLSGFYSGHNV
jgi:hypothetical protein